MAKNSGKALTPPLDPIDIPASINPEVDATPLTGQGESVVIEVPVCRETPPVDHCIHLEVRLTRKQSDVLRMAAAALDRRQAKLADGKRVVYPSNALRFILERLADAVK